MKVIGHLVGEEGRGRAGCRLLRSVWFMGWFEASLSHDWPISVPLAFRLWRGNLE